MSIVQQLLLRALVARFWNEPYRAAAGALGHRAARPLPAAQLRLDGLRRRDRARCTRAGFGFDLAWFAPHFEFRFPQGRRAQRSRRPPGAAQRAGALARDGRGGRGRHHGALRRFDRSSASRCAPAGSIDPRHVVTVNGQRAAAAAHRPRRRVRRRRALPGLAAALGAAPDDRRACAADLRPGRHLDAALAGRLPVPRGASGRAQLRHLPGQRLRGREPAPGALLPHRPHTGPGSPSGRAACRAQPGVSRSRSICGAR